MDRYDKETEGDKYPLQWNALAGWFLGPRAENGKLFNKLVQGTFHAHEEFRRGYFPTDPRYVTGLNKASPAYKSETKQLKEKLAEMNAELSQSTPIFSPRFQGHMNWDITMPSYLGYISGMLWNPNNVDVTASPVTTPYEIIVGDQISDMIGFDRNKDYEPWGHVTCGGSIANIEAMWSSRNLKFYPLSLQATVNDPNNAEELGAAKEYKVRVPAKDFPDETGGNKFVERNLGECSTWQLLNLDVDDACKMAEGVAKKAGPDVTMDRLSVLVHPHSYTSMGIASFLIKHKVNSPRCFCPATCHYSWPKAATVLGIGEDNLILVPLDDKARQDVNHLELLLNKCVEEAVPVISVTAVMGSTEESAMDPLIEIIALREKFRGKGLNFVISADAAWGAYMRTMMIDPNDEQPVPAKRGASGAREASRARAASSRRLPISSFVPISPLNEHTRNNLNALKHADTVTSDPHKTGYCPYPAGGLSYRNGTMKEFVKLAAPEVFHSEDDLSVGINGLEGSKPGAAAAGVLLSHRVIGLDKYGYGRILGQCVYGSKLLYCTWVHLAKPTDPFVIAPLLPCTQEQKDQMLTHIIGKTNEQIYINKAAMDLLTNVGPDALINKFGINYKIGNVLNNDVNESTDFSKKIGSIVSVNADKNTHRVKLIIFQSLMEPDTYGQALIDFEARIGLTKNTDQSFGCMVNTVMNPWQASSVFVTAIGEVYREACFLAYGWKTDPATKHRFVICGTPQYSEKDGWYVFANLCGKFSAAAEQYNAVVKFSIVDEQDAINLRARNTLSPLFLANQTEAVLYPLLEEDGRKEGGIKYDVFTDLESTSPVHSLALKVIDVVNMKRFAPAKEAGLEYPDNQTFFMFGDGDKVYLTHIVTKQLDYQQVVEVSEIPMTKPKDRLLIWYGLKVTFPDLPVNKENPIAKPFTHADRTYKITFAGRKQKKEEMHIVLKNNEGWFDTNYLNV